MNIVNIHGVKAVSYMPKFSEFGRSFGIGGGVEVGMAICNIQSWLVHWLTLLPQFDTTYFQYQIYYLRYIHDKGRRNSFVTVLSSFESHKGIITIQFNVPLRNRRGLSLYKVYGDSALLVLNGTSLMPFWFSANGMYRKGTSIREAPVFRHLGALRKSPWKFIIWMNEL